MIKNEKGSRNLEIAKSRMLDGSLFFYFGNKSFFECSKNNLVWGAGQDRGGGGGGGSFEFGITSWQLD